MKKPISATIEEDLISWVDREISARNKYRNRSHLIDLLRKQEKKEEKR